MPGSFRIVAIALLVGVAAVAAEVVARAFLLHQDYLVVALAAPREVQWLRGLVLLVSLLLGLMGSGLLRGRRRAELGLMRVEEGFELAMRSADEAPWDWDLAAERIRFSARWKSQIGFSEREFANRLERWFERVHPDDLAGLKEAIDRHVAGRSASLSHAYRLRHRDGDYRWMLLHGKGMRAAGAPAHRLVGGQRDITAAKGLEERLNDALGKVMSDRDGVLVTDAEGRIQAFNAGFLRITGLPAERLLGYTPRVLQSGRHDAAFYKEMRRALTRHGHWDGMLWNRRGDGSEVEEHLSITAVRGVDGQVSHYVGLYADVSAAAATRALEGEGHRDADTGLMDRRMFAARLEFALRRARRNGRHCMLVMVGLHGPLGGQPNAAMLNELGRRVEGCARAEDSAGRWSAHRFAFLTEELSQVEEGEARARALSAALDGLDADGWRPALGVALFPDDADDDTSLVDRADTALYWAGEHNEGYRLARDTV